MIEQNRSCETMTCPEYVPIDSVDNFCIPEECKNKIIPTEKYPSPNTCLEHEELEKLEKKIKETNRLLLNLALSQNEEEDDRIDKSVFKSYMDKHVMIYHENADEPFMGKIILVGNDFILIQSDKDKYIIPTTYIEKIEATSAVQEEEHEKRLIKIESCLRRDITFSFGHTVANNPKLINIFYGLNLDVYFLLLIGCEVEIQYGSYVLDGKLSSVKEQILTISINHVCRTIKIEDIDYIRLK